MSKRIQIATAGVASDYKNSLLPRIVTHLGYEVVWTLASSADLIIYGPFHKQKNPTRWIPKPLRPMFAEFRKREPVKTKALTLFQTGENLRHDHLNTDFSLSFDLAMDDLNHLRFPYWMEVVDWSHEGISGGQNPRFGSLISHHRLLEPLGSAFLAKPIQAAFFSSHLREPRATLFKAVSEILPTRGYGAHFDQSVNNHNTSGYTKREVLRDYAFNLCPENGMYPGYYTEKIPEAFMADTLALTWTDSNVSIDFNPGAFINLAPMMHNGFADLETLLRSPSRLAEYAAQPLLLTTPSIERHKVFIKEIVRQALS